MTVDPSRRPNDYRDREDLEARLSSIEALLSTVLVSDDPSRGLVLRSPNNHYWRLTVDDSGAPSWSDLGLVRPT